MSPSFRSAGPSDTRRALLVSSSASRGPVREDPALPHVFEISPSARAKCRGCGAPIAKGELRFGERLPNPFDEGGEMTLWFHTICAAYKRPEPFLEALAAADAAIDDRERLERVAREGITHRRLPRINGAERAPSGRASCRSCHETIVKGEWRFPLVYFSEGRFEPSGFVHTKCSQEYFGTTDVMDRVRHFSRLDEAEVGEIVRALHSPGAS